MENCSLWFQYVFSKLADDVTPRMVAGDHDAGSVLTSHRYTHICRIAPDYLGEMTCSDEKPRSEI